MNDETTYVEANGRRSLSCVEVWPDCESGYYDPRCCRFPKSCSANTFGLVDESLLEPITETARWETTVDRPTYEIDVMAWVIIANAHGGNWDEASDEWRAAAERWRDEYHKTFARQQPVGRQ